MPSVPAAVCMACAQVMRVVKIGQTIALHSRETGGTAYIIVSGDVYECRMCNTRVTARFGNPIERHHKEFENLHGSPKTIHGTF